MKKLYHNISFYIVLNDNSLLIEIKNYLYKFILHIASQDKACHVSTYISDTITSNTLNIRNTCTKKKKRSPGTPFGSGEGQSDHLRKGKDTQTTSEEGKGQSDSI